MRDSFDYTARILSLQFKNNLGEGCLSFASNLFYISCFFTISAHVSFNAI